VDMDSSVVLEAIDNGVAVLTLNRPESLNALSSELFTRLSEAIARLSGRSEVGVIVLTGSGRAFCSGGDVNQMPGRSEDMSFEDRVADLTRRASIVALIAECSKLTIAMINGVAYGAGLALALACDFRIACASAKLVTGYIKMGFSGDCGGVYLLTHLVGPAKAKELFYFSDPLTATEAFEIGLVTRCVPDDDLKATTDSFAQKLAAGPRVAQQYMKSNFLNASLTLREALAIESRYLVQTALTDDHAEAKQAFRERRAPIFKGC
jgi:2-(1,2-epoxy-1,2-dihydrophenyl)acetyl-CoA isomerase